MAGQEDLFLEKAEYCLDTSSIIVLRQLYPKDIPIFDELHKIIQKLLSSGRVAIVDLVLDELKSKEPELYAFIRAYLPKERLNKFDNYILETQRIIRTHYDGRGKSHKLKADPHVISCAKKEGLLVVTEELNSDETKMPSVCIKENVNYISFLDLIRKLIKKSN